MSGPLRSVLDALAAGARSRQELVATTGLARDVVDAALEHLVLAGRLESAPLVTGCPSTGCGACPSANCDRSGPVLVGLSLRRTA